MNEQRDPFTNAPLTLADLIEMPELKEEIEEYKAIKMSLM